MADVTYERVVNYWQTKKIINSAAMDVVVNDVAVSMAYNSTRIEVPTVNYQDAKEIFKSGRVTEYTGFVKDITSLQNAKFSWNAFLEAFEDGCKLNEALVKDFHRVLTMGTFDEKRYREGERPGHYKKGDFVTGRYEIGALAEDVPEEMDELLQDVQDVPPEKALTAAAFFHAKFENIHPFADGNGRTGRLLMNYLLVLHDHPIIVIHEEDKKGYMEALEAWDTKQELEPLKEYLKEQAVKTWSHRIR